MSRRRISQREARAALARVRQLEALISAERNVYARALPGTLIGKVAWSEPGETSIAAFTAQHLGFAVVVKAWDDKKTLAFYAVPREVA